MSGTFMLEPELAAAAALENVLPDLANDLVRAKNYLKTQSSATGDSLYEHLADVVRWLVTHEPSDAADNVEQYSWRVRLDKFRPDFPAARLADVYLSPRQLQLARKLNQMIETVQSKAPKLDALGEEEEPELDLEEDSQIAAVPDIIQNNYYFKQAGFGLPDCECHDVYMALKLLTINEPIGSVRFLGKIFGLKANYYVAETELKIEEMDRRIREFEMRDMPGEGDGQGEGELSALGASEPALAEKEHRINAVGEGEAGETPPKERTPPPLPAVPQSAWVPPPRVPQERPGQGLNRKAYWVCNYPGDLWVCLPDVTPQQVDVARKTVRCMTGDLNAEVITYPPFEGTERNLLRAQLARISAATSVSPRGYYTLGSGEEEEDIDLEEGGTGEVEMNVNPMYAGHTLKDLLDPELTYWVHHGRYILKQGRNLWWNPKQTGEEVEEEEEEEEDAEDAVAPERGLPILSPLSEDCRFADGGGGALWSTRASCALAPERSLAALRSNLWPGAVAVATTGKKSECLYVGWGLKYQVHNYSPPPLPPVWDEYPLGADIMEMTDPSFADEEAYRIAHLPPPPPPVLPGEGAEELGEEEEEEDEEE